MLRRSKVPFPAAVIDFAALFSGSNELTIKSWEERWIHNVQYNRQLIDKAPESYRMARELIGTKRYHVAIACGAGPSLEKQARFLREAPEDWAIVCTDHSLHAVLAEGVTPTVVITMDGDQTDDPYIQEGMRILKYRNPETPIIADVVCCPTVTTKAMNLFWFRSVTSPESRIVQFVRALFPDITLIGHGGNVGSMALIVSAFFLFARHVIIVGMDSSLAAGFDRQLYYHGQEASAHHDFVDVHDIYGRNIQTIGNLHNYKVWSDHFTYLNNFVEWILANDGGYLGVNSASDIFDHYKYLPLKEAIAYLKTHGPED